MKLSFPFKGIHKGVATSSQPPVTSFDMNNMRLYDVLNHRARGGQRPAIRKWGAGTQIGAAEQPVVAICIVSSVE